MKELMHYSREGYDGNYIYTSACGKKIKTHQEKIGITIHPAEANCKDCLASKQYKTDLKDSTTIKSNIKRRIYIESDILNSDEFRSAQREALDFAKKQKLKCVDRVFSEVLDYAWHNLEKTWQAVKDADEIYATSSLMPLTGGSYNGAPVIFNKMCEKAIQEKIEGKSVFILNALSSIYWGMIDKKLMLKAFARNKLYMYDDEDFNNLVEQDIKKIIKGIK